MATRDDEIMAMTRDQHRAIFDTNTTATAGPNREPVDQGYQQKCRENMHQSSEALWLSQQQSSLAESARLFHASTPPPPQPSPVAQCCGELGHALQLQETLLSELLERVRPVLRQSPVDEVERAQPPSYGAALPDQLQQMATQLVRQNQFLQALMDRLTL